MSRALATLKGDALVPQDGAVTAELHESAQQAAVIQEIQGAICVAQKFPRDEDACYQKIQRSCQRLAFAEDAQYAFPRGGTTVRGPSVYFAREFARAWGNIRHGCYIYQDDAYTRTIRAWAWDLETNTKVELDDSFRKLVQRRRDGETKWVEPDERDLRELTNRRAAIAKRNCILELLPADLVEEALNECDKTIQGGIDKDPAEAKKKLLKAFGDIGVRAAELKDHLGCPLEQATTAQIAELRRIYKAIKDGTTTWQESRHQRPDVSNGLPTGRTKVGGKKEPPQEASQVTEEAPPDPAELAREDAYRDLSERVGACESEAELEAVSAQITERQNDLGALAIKELDKQIRAKAKQLQSAD